MSKDAQNDEVIALLSEQERLQAIELAVYKKLFGDDPKNMKDDAINANSAVGPKKNKASESNDGENTRKSATPTVKKTNDTEEARDPVDSNTTNAVAGISHREQAAKTLPPPEGIQLTDRQKRVLARREAPREKMGPAAWHRMEEAHKKNLPIAAEREAIHIKQDKLLPMRPDGKIQQFSTYAPPTSECEYYWFAEDGAQMKKDEQKLNVKVIYIFEKSRRFRLWPDPADWYAFEKDTVEGMELLSRCEKFMEFWIWVFTSKSRVTGRASLTTCLEWFLLGEASPEYKGFTRLAPAPKPMNDAEAIEVFKEDIQEKRR